MVYWDIQNRQPPETPKAEESSPAPYSEDRRQPVVRVVMARRSTGQPRRGSTFRIKKGATRATSIIEALADGETNTNGEIPIGSA
jgi:hypothetical protein